MLLISRILTLAALAAILVMATLHLRATALPERLPAEIPAAWAPGDPSPSAWTFVRPGCAHCEAHLVSLSRAAGRRDACRRQELLGRIRVVGDFERVPAGVRRLPDRMRRDFGVRTTPTTLLVEPGGRVRQAWRGACGVRQWEQALDFLDGRAVSP